MMSHPGVEQVLQVEIDERVTRLSEKYFPDLCESNNDARAGFYFGDGIQWMKDAAAGSIDVIIVDSTDPVGPAQGLFSAAFYRDCHQALGERGVIIQQSESPLLHYESIIQLMHKAMGDAGFTDSISPCSSRNPTTPLAGGRPPWRVKKIFATSAKTMRNKRGSRRGTTTPPFTWAHWPNRNSS